MNGSSTRRLRCHTLRVCLVLAGLCLFGTSAQAEKIYNFGIVPQQAASKLAKTWAPILKYLGEQTGYKFQFATAKDIPAFEELLNKGRYDFAYMNPYHYVVYHKQSGYEAFAKARDKQIHGIFVVHKDSPYQNLADLKGQKLAFPSPGAFAASILPRAELARQGIDFSPVYVSSHDSVYRNIAAKYFIAGGGVVRTYKALVPEVRDQLRILYQTTGYTPHAFAAHPKVAADVVKKVRMALENLETGDTGKLLLDALKIKGIQAAGDGDWDDVRKLKLNQ